MEPKDELTELIHRELMKLPERTAPADLLPRVLSRIERQRRHWWERPWFTWPWAAKLISLPFPLLLAGGLIVGVATLMRLPLAHWTSAQGAALLRPLVSAAEPFMGVAKGLLPLSPALLEPWVLASVAALICFMYLTCVAAGTACFRIAGTPARRK